MSINALGADGGIKGEGGKKGGKEEGARGQRGRKNSLDKSIFSLPLFLPHSSQFEGDSCAYKRSRKEESVVISAYFPLSLFLCFLSPDSDERSALYFILAEREREFVSKRRGRSDGARQDRQQCFDLFPTRGRGRVCLAPLFFSISSCVCLSFSLDPSIRVLLEGVKEHCLALPESGFRAF